MHYIDIWRCSSCQRILGHELRIGAGSFVSAVCWGEGCGEMNALTVNRDGTTGNNAKGGFAFVGTEKERTEFQKAVEAKLLERSLGPKPLTSKRKEAS